MQREHVLRHALGLLEQRGLGMTTLEMVAKELELTVSDLSRFWPDREALLYDCLRFHAQQIDTWRRKLMLDEELNGEQKLLARYQVLDEHVQNQRYPGCLFIAACSFYPEVDHPIHQLAEQQKQASYQYTLELLQEMEADDAPSVALQMELILEGCLSKLLVKRQRTDVELAKNLAQDVLYIAQCRRNGALG